MIREQNDRRIGPGVVALRLFLTVGTLEGLVALVYLFRIPSDDQSALLFGYSQARLVVAIAAAILLLIFLGLSARALLQPSYAEELGRVLTQVLQKEHLALHVSGGLVVLLGYSVFILVLIYVIPEAGSGLLRLIFERTASLFYWMIALALQSLVILILPYTSLIRRQFHSRPDILLRESVFIICSLLTLIHWSILVLHLDWFHQMYGWYFDFWRRSPSRFGLFLILLFVALLTIRIVLKKPKRLTQNLFVLIGLGYALQIGFGYIEGQGWESLRRRYVEKGRATYSEIVARDDFDVRSITDYERNYANVYRFLSTKPQGFLLFHAATRGIQQLFQVSGDQGDNFTDLTLFMAVVYPLLAMLALPLVANLARRLLPAGLELTSVVFYLSFPGILLFTLQLDQVLFPLVFAAGALFVVKVSPNSSRIQALGLGAYLYLGVFLSFSLLPLLVFTVTYLFLTQVHKRAANPASWVRWLGTIALMTAAFLALHFSLRSLLNIDLIDRLTHAMDAHRSAKGSMWELPGTSLLNISEFAFWMGFTLLPFLVVRVGKTIAAFLRGKVGQLDILTASMTITSVALILLGTTRGEVARLWLFTLPLLAILASSEIDLLPFRRKANVMLVAGYQLTSTYLIFLFQFPFQ